MLIKNGNGGTMFVAQTTYSPDLFGHLDITSLEKVKGFTLILDNPFVQLNKWVHPVAMRNQCKLVIAPNTVPNMRERSPVAEYCFKYHVPFVHCELKSNTTLHYVNMYDCTFVNLAGVGERPQLLLVGIPKWKEVVHIPEHPDIIGLSTNTIDLSTVVELKVPGKLYGAFKKEFASKCQLGQYITYRRQEPRCGLSSLFSGFKDESELIYDKI